MDETVVLSDFLKKETEEEILQRMLSRVPDDMDKTEGSYIWDALSPAAFELYQQREFSRYVIMQAFVRHAEGPFLDEHAKDYGTERTITYAKTTVLINGNPGTIVPKGTSAGVEGTDIAFTTDKEITLIDGSGTVDATCTTPGSSGNVLAHKITILLDSIDGITSIDNPNPASGGTDREEDEPFRTRLLFLKENKEKGGANSDYERWALQVPGVQWAKAIDKARGIGTVDLIIAGDPSMIDDLVIQVQAVVDLKKISGTDVKVRKVSILKETFNIYVTEIPKEDAYNAAMNYLSSVGVGGKVTLSKIVTAIIVAGATDAIVNTPNENIQLEADCIIDPVVNII